MKRLWALGYGLWAMGCGCKRSVSGESAWNASVIPCRTSGSSGSGAKRIG